MKVIKVLDPSGYNTLRYKDKFAKMNETKFKAYIKALSEGTTQIDVQFPPVETSLHMDDIYAAAEITKTKLFQRIWMTDPITQEEYLSNEEYLIANVPIRRLQQFVAKKMSVPDNDNKTDMLTGQVIQESRATSMSNPEIQMLYAKGLKNTLLELVKVRGGDVTAYSEFKRQLEETGFSDISQVLNGNTHAGAVGVADSILRGMGLDSNFID